jgi:hypothetical protein
MAGGLLNLLVGVYHAWLVPTLQQTASPDREVLQALNVAAAAVFLFIAYVSFFLQPELLSTGLGRALLIFVCLLHVGRCLGEMFWYPMTPLVFGGSLGLALIYAWILALRAWPKGAEVGPLGGAATAGK